MPVRGGQEGTDVEGRTGAGAAACAQAEPLTGPCQLPHESSHHGHGVALHGMVLPGAAGKHALRCTPQPRQARPPEQQGHGLIEGLQHRVHDELVLVLRGGDVEHEVAQVLVHHHVVVKHNDFGCGQGHWGCVEGAGQAGCI